MVQEKKEAVAQKEPSVIYRRVTMTWLSSQFYELAVIAPRTAMRDDQDQRMSLFFLILSSNLI